MFFRQNQLHHLLLCLLKRFLIAEHKNDYKKVLDDHYLSTSDSTSAIGDFIDLLSVSASQTTRDKQSS